MRVAALGLWLVLSLPRTAGAQWVPVGEEGVRSLEDRANAIALDGYFGLRVPRLAFGLGPGARVWVAHTWLMQLRSLIFAPQGPLDDVEKVDFRTRYGEAPDVIKQVYAEIDAEVGIPILADEVVVAEDTTQGGLAWSAEVPARRILSLVAGLHLAVGGERSELAIPAGLRVGRKASAVINQRLFFFAEWWTQARVLVFTSGKVGFDGEVGIGNNIGVCLFLSYYPELHPSEPVVGRGFSVRPGVSAFNPVPGEAPWFIGLRARVSWNIAL